MSGEPDFDAERRSLGGGPSETRRGLQRIRLLQAQPSKPRRGLRGLALAGVALALGLAAALLLRSPQWVRDQAGPVSLGQVLVAEGKRDFTFSDGSSVSVAHGGALRLDAVDERQVQLRLERGHLEAQVTKSTGRTWRYLAGPWTILVVGTQLSIDWAPEQGVVGVAVTEGAVQVSGPGGDPVLLRAGESFARGPARASALPRAPRPEAPAPVVSPAGEERARQERPPRPPQPEPAPEVTSNPEEPEPAPPEAVQPAWRVLLTQGRRAEALEEATARGVFATALEDADALALADAARLERRFDLAQVLLARVLEREGPDAAEAAFLLGRFELEAHRPLGAQELFSRSVKLAPHGPFAEQSRGRLLEALLERDDLPAARAAAGDYLAHHPGGAWEQLARKLAGSGSP